MPDSEQAEVEAPVKQLTLAEKERKFVDLTFEKRDISAREKEINSELRQLNDEIRDQWEEQQKTSSGLVDANLHLKKEGFVKVVREGDKATAEEKQRACDALVAAGHEEYVERGFNSQSVSSLAREEHWDQELPEELKGALTFEPEWKLSVRKKTPKKVDGPESLGAAE